MNPSRSFLRRYAMLVAVGTVWAVRPSLAAGMAGLQQVAAIAPANRSTPLPIIIVTGLPHSGTTMTSMLILSAPGVMGPIETGFLFGPPHALDFPFDVWATQPASDGWLGLSDEQCDELKRQRTHLDMYSYVMRESPLFRAANATTYLDKTPEYCYHLDAYMRSVPGARVVVVTKTRMNQWHSFKSRGASEASFAQQWGLFHRGVAAAMEEHGTARIHQLSYEALFQDETARISAGEALFGFLGLPFNVSWFDGKMSTGKRGASNKLQTQLHDGLKGADSDDDGGGGGGGGDEADEKGSSPAPTVQQPVSDQTMGLNLTRFLTVQQPVSDQTIGLNLTRFLEVYAANEKTWVVDVTVGYLPLLINLLIGAFGRGKHMTDYAVFGFDDEVCPALARIGAHACFPMSQYFGSRPPGGRDPNKQAGFKQKREAFWAGRYRFISTLLGEGMSFLLLDCDVGILGDVWASVNTGVDFSGQSAMYPAYVINDFGTWALNNGVGWYNGRNEKAVAWFHTLPPAHDAQISFNEAIRKDGGVFKNDPRCCACETALLPSAGVTVAQFDRCTIHTPHFQTTARSTLVHVVGGDVQSKIQSLRVLGGWYLRDDWETMEKTGPLVHYLNTVTNVSAAPIFLAPERCAGAPYPAAVRLRPQIKPEFWFGGDDDCYINWHKYAPGLNL